MHIFHIVSIPNGTDMENLINGQELLWWVIISLIRMTFMFKSTVILYGEIKY